MFKHINLILVAFPYIQTGIPIVSGVDWAGSAKCVFPANVKMVTFATAETTAVSYLTKWSQRNISQLSKT